jgi:hypothetical protein
VQFAFLIVDAPKAKCFSYTILFGPIFEVCRGQMKFFKMRNKMQHLFLIVDVSKAKCFCYIIILYLVQSLKCAGQMKFVKIRVNIVIGDQMASLQPLPHIH